MGCSDRIPLFAGQLLCGSGVPSYHLPLKIPSTGPGTGAGYVSSSLPRCALLPTLAVHPLVQEQVPDIFSHLWWFLYRE